ncbi:MULTISPECIES: GGDEF domain-containing protein [unclassified Arthrobacter]|uniref:GGDEF domain-containing protein n=1 Tax=unclassified Arthrobacter TaxID=235627 RepID=UPI0003FF54D7|nr:MULTISPECIES: GGDEF domain-containing protein [unclassified Arthrobacter]PVE19414.1 GGDEF domain-containing protein [Arthrobacter sp. Bz4]
MYTPPRTNSPAAFASLLNWLRRTRPFPYPREVAVSAMALFYLVGGVAMLLVLVFPHPSTLNDRLLIGLGVFLIVIGLPVYKLRHRTPLALLPWLLAAGTAVITALTATGGSTSVTVSFSFFYLWVIIFALLFLNPLVAAVEIGFAAVAYLSVAVLPQEQSTHQLTAFEPIALFTVVTTTGGVIMWLSQAREHSEIDPLTLVMNRRGLDRILQAALSGDDPTGKRLVAGLIDVDHFKSVNDRQGHAAGDRLLEELAGAWQRVLRSGDTLGRIGGDEFVVLLPGCSASEADDILERLRAAALDLQVTRSVGAALSEDQDSASLLLGRADTALYQAKNLGRNRVAWAVA